MTAEEIVLKNRGLKNLEFEKVLDLFLERYHGTRLDTVLEEYGGFDKFYQNYESFRDQYSITTAQHWDWWDYLYKLLKSRFKQNVKMTEGYIFSFNINCLTKIKDGQSSN